VVVEKVEAILRIVIQVIEFDLNGEWIEAPKPISRS
jgi:hypothetical protein